MRVIPDVDAPVIGYASGEVRIGGRASTADAVYLHDLGGWVWSDADHLDLWEHDLRGLPVPYAAEEQDVKQYRYRYSLLVLLLFAQNVVFAQEASPCRVDANSILSLDWHPWGHTVAFGSNCGVLLLNDALDELIAILPVENAEDVNFPTYNHDGTLVAASIDYLDGMPSEIRIWETSTNTVFRTLEDFSSMPIAWHPIRNIFVFGPFDKVRVYDVDTTRITYEFTPPTNDTVDPPYYPYLVCWSPQGEYILAAFEWTNGYLITYPSWEVTDTQFIAYYGASCTPDATLLGGSGEIFDLRTGTSTESNGNCVGVSMAWRAAGELQHAVNCLDEAVRVYDREARVLFTLEGSYSGRAFIQAARSIEYSPDGSRLIAVGNDGVARLWDTSNYELITRVNVAEMANLALAQQ